MNVEELAMTAGSRPGRRIRERVKARFLSTSFMLSFMCLVAGICLATRGSSTDCITFFQWGLIYIGIGLMATFIAVVNCLGRCNKVASGVHLLGMLVAIVALLALMIEAFVHINIKGNVQDEPDDKLSSDGPQPVREYHLGDYGGRLRRRVADERYWDRLSGCLRRRHACNGMSPLLRDPKTGALLAQRQSFKYPGDLGLSPIENILACHSLSSLSLNCVKGSPEQKAHVAVQKSTMLFAWNILREILTSNIPQSILQTVPAKLNL